MPKMTASSMVVRKDRLASFTLIELLTVMAIILILAALLLMAGSGVMKKAARSRASAEIQAMSAALEGYKADNGYYPPSDGTLLLTNSTYSYSSLDGTGTAYQTNSQILYRALSGQTNFNDVHVLGAKSYMPFKINQLGNYTAAAGTTGSGSTYIKDPWGYSYAYSTGTLSGAATTNYPYNGSGFFDLWSTGGVSAAQASATPSLTNAWLNNWQQ